MDKKEKIKKVCLIISAVVLSIAFILMCIVSVIGRNDETSTASAETLEKVQDCNTYIYIPAGTLLTAFGSPYVPYTGLLCYVSLDLNTDYCVIYPMFWKINGNQNGYQNYILFVNPASGIVIINEDIYIPCNYSGDLVGSIKFKVNSSDLSNYWYISSDSYSLVTIDNVLSFESGYCSGYNEGFNVGFDTSINDLSPITIFLQPIQTFFDTKLFGSLSVGYVLNIVLFVCLALIFLKMFAG